MSIAGIVGNIYSNVAFLKCANPEAFRATDALQDRCSEHPSGMTMEARLLVQGRGQNFRLSENPRFSPAITVT